MPQNMTHVNIIQKKKWVLFSDFITCNRKVNYKGMMLISTNVIHESKISGRISLRVSLFGNRFTIRYFVLFIWKNHDLDMDGPFLPQKDSSTINFVLFNRTVKFVNT